MTLYGSVSILALTFYFVGTVNYFLFLIARRQLVSTMATASVIAGLLFHTAGILLHLSQTGRLPFSNIQESLSFFSWATILVYIFAEFRYKLKALGVFIVPLVFLGTVYAGVVPGVVAPEGPRLGTFWLAVHAILNFLGVAAFALTFGVGMMYLIQEKQLKSKKLGVLYYRLPSLEMLDDLNYKALLLGFPLLTLGNLAGSLWATYAANANWFWGPQAWLLILTWLGYGVLFWGRLTLGWRGKKAARFAVLSFFAVVFAYLVHISSRG